MPVEIKELVISVSVQTRAGEGESLSKAAKAVAAVPPADEREAIVQACVEQVMQILRRSRER